jgi:hypothetical protein
MVLEAAAKSRDGIGDSDLDDEQHVSVTISTTLGLLRKAGLRYVAGYTLLLAILAFAITGCGSSESTTSSTTPQPAATSEVPSTETTAEEPAAEAPMPTPAEQQAKECPGCGTKAHEEHVEAKEHEVNSEVKAIEESKGG